MTLIGVSLRSHYDERIADAFEYFSAQERRWKSEDPEHLPREDRRK